VEYEYARLSGALLELKALEAAHSRTFAGLATTPDLDRQGHSIDPAGVTYRNPLPLLFQHDQKLPIGWATFGAATASGIPFTAHLPQIDEPGPLKDRISEVWQLIKAGLITSVSIGFRILDDAVKPIKGGMRLLRTEVVELSLVTIPSNPHASILLVKSLAALGPNPSAALGGPRSLGTTMTLSEQIRSYESTRASKAAEMMAMMAAAADHGVTLDAAERDRYDNLDAEVQSLDDHITRAKRTDALQMANLAPVPQTPTASRLPAISIRKDLPPGTAFVRGALALLRANGNRYEAVEHAKQWQDSTPEVALWLKAAVAPGTTTDPAWAGVLAQAQNVTNEFVELLRPATILGKIPNLKKVPFNVSVPIQTLGGVYGWTGQGAPKKVTKLGFGTDKLVITKATGIIVLTEELVRSSDPSAEAICRADMIAGIAQFLDSQFIDPTVAEVINVNPPSITNGTTAIASSGSALADIHALISALAAANVPLGGVTLIMSETNAFTLGMTRDAYGNRVFPGMGATGGTVDGINVVTSNTAGTNVIAVQPQFVLYADDGGVQIDLSREASLQMDDAPMNPADATTVFTSLWQNNLVGLRAERFINWKRVKLEAVKYVSGATYAPAYIAPGTGTLGGGAPLTGRGASAKQS
jgi:HK97 family phage major capsid protein/HK97 family phage prohead protease